VPGGGRRWDAQITEERPGELLRWSSLGDAELPNEGTVRFAPAPAEWGTEVSLHLRFGPPGGALGRAAANLLPVIPRMAVDKALRRFKSLAETGEIPRLERNATAR
jgi:uncharacterized membrane protein